MSRKKKNQRVTISSMYCTQCGRRGIDIPRLPCQQREPGHLKKLYCMYCKKETNHAEIRPYGGYTLEDFKEEFNLGRFVDGQKIPVAELMSCSEKDCDYNKSGRCWNSNHSFDCGHRKEDRAKAKANEVFNMFMDVAKETKISDDYYI